MRTKSAQATAVLANPSHSARALVTVYSSAGVAGPTWGAGAAEGQLDPVIAVEVSQDIDSFRTAKVTLQRQQGRYSLAPLVETGNPLFGTEAPVAIGRRVVIEAELQLPDISRTPAGLKETIFDGYIDEVAWPTDDMELICTDKSARLRDTWIEVERAYCFAQGANALKGCLVFRYDLPALALDDLVLPSKELANGHYYKVTAVTGPQSAAEPVWPTGSGATVVSMGVTFTEAGLTSATTGLALETLIQQVLNDNNLGSLVTLQTPASPAWQVKPYLQQRESVMSAIETMVSQLGWWCRFEWSASLGKYELTLAQPDRASATVHKTLDQVEEGECSELGIAVWDIRNVVRVIYGDSGSRDPLGAPTRITREVSDAASIAKYGRRFMEIAEDDASNIDTAAEADRMANAVLADLKDPTISTSCSFPCDFYLELGDRLTLPADTLRFTSSLTLAVGSLKHTFKDDSAKTEVTLRGQPAARQTGWFGIEGRARPSDVHQLAQLNSTGSLLTTGPVVGGQKFSIKDSGGKTKGALNQGYEVHISATPGAAPDATTLKASGELDTFVLADLVPGKTYYAKTVPRSTNTERIVRGEPSAELSFVAGQANAGHYSSTSTQSHLPLNGNFEHMSDPIGPPDHWTPATLGADPAESWGATGTVYFGNDTAKGNFLKLSKGSVNGRGRAVSSLFEIRRGMRESNIYFSVRRQTASAASGQDLQVVIRGFADAAGATPVFTYTVQISADALGPYPTLNTWYEVKSNMAGFASPPIPTNCNFVRIDLQREAAGAGTVVWEIGDVYWQEADFFNMEGDTLLLHQNLTVDGSTSLQTLSAQSITQPAWTAPTFETNWGNNGGGWMPAGYYKGADGRIVVRGLVKITTATLTAPIWTFPVGYRPTAGTHQFPVRCGDNTLSYLYLGTSGVLSFGGTLAQGQSAFMTEFSFDTR